ncbi:YqiA/YcfP family alpha/beta fold hydrolase [Psychrobacter sp. CAM01]|uniref:YqiA/YcfP family alpha/beta fold hydrolase n=1 Tax=Psychrobacter sp. CAM01 TaxID=3080335 RepID=UPI002936057A|nr:YqiA/YcfP family alpha/beta fold hydrolase [Psychrobacter sp. CAM01]MDV2859282.1 YqiA/YcfP family alpha/beta fold hydrolase [Psychrobacter sp. CAM01]
MNIIYIHGLDSDANSIKGSLLEEYCRQYDPDIKVLRPDLNKTPNQVFDQMLSLIDSVASKDTYGQDTVLVGSSLGGYFATLLSNHTGCPALLLNPSIQPHQTLQRFKHSAETKDESAKNEASEVLYTTSGGWRITNADLEWFACHQLSSLNYPKKVVALIKEGDELLNSSLSANFYREQGATVDMQKGGDHRFSDFKTQLPKVIEVIQQVVKGRLV